MCIRDRIRASPPKMPGWELCTVRHAASISPATAPAANVTTVFILLNIPLNLPEIPVKCVPQGCWLRPVSYTHLVRARAGFAGAPAHPPEHPAPRAFLPRSCEMCIRDRSSWPKAKTHASNSALAGVSKSIVALPGKKSFSNAFSNAGISL